MANSIFPEAMLKTSSEELSLEIIISKLVYFQEQLQLLHWQTNSYSEHIALGEMYDYVYTFKDDVVEKLMGYLNKKPLIYKTEQLSNTTAIKLLEAICKFTYDLKNYGETYKFLDVCNLADELSGKASKTKYLLTLK